MSDCDEVLFTELGDPTNLKVLFVCIGNSCRSPMAESILKHICSNESVPLNWTIDSAALETWNVGRPPEPRCLLVLAENGMTSYHIGRQICRGDFEKFDYIFAMDLSNKECLMEMCPSKYQNKIQLIGAYDCQYNKIVIDPYFESGDHGFRRCFQQLYRSCSNFVEQQLKRINTSQ